MGWKGHKTRMPLGVFAKQCSESVHHNMLKTLSRFSTSESRSNLGVLLRRALLEYSSNRI